MRKRRNPLIDAQGNQVLPIPKRKDEKTGRDVIDFNFAQIKGLKYKTLGNVVISLNPLIGQFATTVANSSEKLTEQTQQLGDAWDPDIQSYGRFFNAMQKDFQEVGQKIVPALRRATTEQQVINILSDYFSTIFRLRLQDGDAKVKQKLEQQQALESEFESQLDQETTTQRVALEEKLSELAKAYKQLQVWYNGVAPTEEELDRLRSEVELHNDNFDAYIKQLDQKGEPDAKKLFIETFVAERLSTYLSSAAQSQDERIARRRKFETDKAEAEYAKQEIDPFLYRLFPIPNSLRMVLLKMLMGEPIAVYKRLGSKLDYTRATYKTYLGKKRNRFGVVESGETPGTARSLYARYLKNVQKSNSLPSSDGYTRYIIRNWVPVIKEFQPNPQYVEILSSKLLMGSTLEQGEYDPLLGVSGDLANYIDDSLGEKEVFEAFDALRSKVKKVVTPLFSRILFYKSKIISTDELDCFYQKDFYDLYEKERSNVNFTDLVSAYLQDSDVLPEEKTEIQSVVDGEYSPSQRSIVWSWYLLKSHPYLANMVKGESEFVKVFLAPQTKRLAEEVGTREQYGQSGFVIDKEPYISALKVTDKDIQLAKDKLERSYFSYRKSLEYKKLEQEIGNYQAEYNRNKNEILSYVKGGLIPEWMLPDTRGTNDYWLRKPLNIGKLSPLRDVLVRMQAELQKPREQRLSRSKTLEQDLDRLKSIYNSMVKQQQEIDKKRKEQADLKISVGIDYKRVYLKALQSLQDKLMWREGQRSKGNQPTKSFFPKVGDNVSISIGKGQGQLIPAQIIELDYNSRVAKLLPSKEFYKPFLDKYEDRVILAPLRLLKSAGLQVDAEFAKKYSASDAVDPYIFLKIIKASSVPKAVGQYRELPLTKKYTSDPSQIGQTIGTEIISIGPFGSSESAFHLKKGEALVAVSDGDKFNYDQLYKVRIDDLGVPILTLEQAIVWPKLYVPSPSLFIGPIDFRTFDTTKLITRHNPHRSLDYNFVLWALWGSVLNAVMIDMIGSSDFRTVADVLDSPDLITLEDIKRERNTIMQFAKNLAKSKGDIGQDVLEREKANLKSQSEQLNQLEQDIRAGREVYTRTGEVKNEIQSVIATGLQVDKESIDVMSLVQYLAYFVYTRCLADYEDEVSRFLFGRARQDAVDRVRATIESKKVVYAQLEERRDGTQDSAKIDLLNKEMLNLYNEIIELEDREEQERNADTATRDLPFSPKKVFANQFEEWYTNFTTQNWNGLSCYWKLRSNWKSTPQNIRITTVRQKTVWANRYRESELCITDDTTIDTIQITFRDANQVTKTTKLPKTPFMVDFRSRQFGRRSNNQTVSVSYSKFLRYEQSARRQYKGEINSQKYYLFHEGKPYYPYSAAFANNEKSSAFLQQKQAYNAVDPYFYIPVNVYNSIRTSMKTRMDLLLESKEQGRIGGSSAPTEDKLIKAIFDAPTIPKEPKKQRSKKRRNPKDKTSFQVFIKQCLPQLKLAVEYILQSDYMKLTREFDRDEDTSI